MLILNRKVGESIIIDDRIEVKVLEIVDGKVKLGIEAPREVPVFRNEVFEEVRNENTQAASISMQVFETLKGNR